MAEGAVNRFEPPHCPNPRCKCHLSPQDHNGPWYINFGHYSNKQEKTIARYKCKVCKKSFSERTFDIRYYDHKKYAYKKLFYLRNLGMSLRSISLFCKIPRQRVFRALAKLSRQSLAVHSRMLIELMRWGSSESIVFDGILNFVHSKTKATSMQISVLKWSQLVTDYDQTFVKRQGKMSKSALKRAKKHYALHPIPKKGLQESCERVFGAIDKRNQGNLVCLYSDMHLSYPKALVNLGLTHWFHYRISSKMKRNLYNPLFAVNYMEREIRKDNADFERKTEKYSKRLEYQSERIMNYVVWHNLRKRRRVNDTLDKRVHGECAGLEKNWIKEQWRSMFKDRAFGSRVYLDTWMIRIWNRTGGSSELKIAKMANYLRVYVPRKLRSLEFWRSFQSSAAPFSHPSLPG